MDRVKLRPLERAELNDTLALTDLVYEYTQRLFGGLLGAGNVKAKGRGGLLSISGATYSSALDQLSFQTFNYLELTESGATPVLTTAEAAPEGRIIRFDPVHVNHVNYPIDVSATNTDGVEHKLWARSITIETDTDFRRQWDIGTQSEVSASMTTRRRERIEFTTTIASGSPTESSSTEIGPWVPLLSYTITSGVLSIDPYWAFDEANEKIKAILYPTLDTLDRISSHRLSNIAAQQSTATGLLGHIAALKLQMYRVIVDGAGDTLTSPSVNEDWITQPALSLKEISSTLSQLRTDVDSNDTTIDNVAAREQTFKCVVSAVSTTSPAFVQVTTNIFRPDGTQASDFDVVFNADLLAAPIASPNALTTNADLLKLIQYPVLKFSSAYDQAEIISCQVVPNIDVNPLTGLQSMMDISVQTAHPNVPEHLPFAIAFNTADGITHTGKIYSRSYVAYDQTTATNLNAQLLINMSHLLASNSQNGDYDYSYTILITVRKAQS